MKPKIYSEHFNCKIAGLFEIVGISTFGIPVGTAINLCNENAFQNKDKTFSILFETHNCIVREVKEI